MKDMTEEELDAYMESIPEWKRGALVHVADKESKEEKGMFGKMKDKIKGKVTSTDQFKTFQESEDFAKLKQFQKEYKEFKGDVKE